MIKERMIATISCMAVLLISGCVSSPTITSSTNNAPQVVDPKDLTLTMPLAEELPLKLIEHLFSGKAIEGEQPGCSGFFDADKADHEYTAVLGSLTLAVSGRDAAIREVVGLPSYLKLNIQGKVVSATTSLAMLKRLYPKQSYEIQTGKHSDNPRQPMSLFNPNAPTYDQYFFARPLHSDDAYHFYLKQGKLIGVEYFIPC